MLIVVRAISSRSDTGRLSSRSDTGRRDAYSRAATSVVAGLEADAHSDIDPDDPSNMSSLLAFDWTHAVPQSS